MELDFEGLHQCTLHLSKEISETYTPDVVAYLARGGYLMGCDVAGFFDCKLIELSRHRSEAIPKNANILSVLPSWLKHVLREIEFHARGNGKITANIGNVVPAEISQRYPIPVKADRVLIVDDSVDSGESIMAACSTIHTLYPEAEVRVAVLNTFQLESAVIPCDWSLYRNVLLSTPASKDSHCYGEFCRLYETDGYR